MSSLYFAEGYTGNPDSQFETWLLIQNTSNDEKIAVVDYVLGSGEVITREVPLPPNSRTTIYANDVLGQEALSSPCTCAPRMGRPACWRNAPCTSTTSAPSATR